jgi:serine protease
MIDSDVNDPFAPFSPNNNFSTAQNLTNPVTVGGYVNVAGTGDPGRSQVSGDPSDFFQITLAAGQTINLFIAEDPTADLDLFLYDISQNPIDSSQNPSGTETLTIPANDTYFVEVTSASNASNYILTIGQTPNVAGQANLRLSDEFVPGEVIVRFRDDNHPSKSLQSAASLANSVGLRAKAGAPGREMLLGFDDETGKQRAFRTLGIKQQKSTQAFVDPIIQPKLDTLKIIKALRQRPDVLIAEPNYIWRAFTTPDDPSYSIQWHYPLINLPQTWDNTTGSNTVIVAVIDTGVLLNHPDLDGNLNDILAPGYDFIRDPASAVDNESLPGSPPDIDIDPNPDDPGDQKPGGSSFHGTHVAGTIAAETNNATGVAGVTWKSLIMPLRVLGKGGGTAYDVEQAVYYAAGLPNDSGTTPPTRADIINLSLGGGISQTAQNVFNQARNAGVIIVAAAGNQSSSAPSYPAAYNGVVSVSAVDINKSLVWYSNFGSTIDVAAPGGDNGADLNVDGFPDGVLSTCGDDTSAPPVEFVYCFFQGTSMAAPHMAGVVALMKAIHGNLTPDELDTLLTNGNITEDLGGLGRDNQFGHGLIDALKAVAEAENLASGGDLPATLIAKPVSLNFGITRGPVDLELSNGGGSSTILNVTSINPSEAWVTVTPTGNVGADGLGTYIVTINDSGVDDGVYSAKIDIISDANNVVVPISIQVGIPPVQGGDAGFHYVLLVNLVTLQIYQDDVAFSGSGYSYSFTNVQAGIYNIFAGTDSDNDLIIGDAGEAFGVYQTVDQPIAVVISRNTSGLDFISSFDVTLPSHLTAGEPFNRPIIQRLRFREKSN